MVARTPRKRMYRTMQGRMIDIEKLRGANEEIKAVGNMNVNARGDVMGVGGNIATPKSQVIKNYYEAPKGRVDDTPARAKPTPVRRTAPQPKAVEAKPAPQPKKVTKQTKSKSASTPKKGIDAALDGLE
tara:strand:- start:2657 stop:3043 length:387 start_codon:yes stop_codon:yes gene_type:complete